MYPIFMDMNGVSCTVIGAGNVAKRRISGLLSEGACVTVVAPEPMPEELAKLKQQKNSELKYLQQSYSPSCLKNAAFVFACTDSPELNSQIVADAREIGSYAASVTSDRRGSDFTLPSFRTVGRITVAVSTGGVSPGLSAAICREIYPKIEEYAEICEIQSVLRERWKEEISDPEKRHEALCELSSPETLSIYREQGALEYLKRAESFSGKTVPSKKTAILVVSFGTSYENTREKTIGAVERAIREAFPQADVFRAFTSGMIIRKMRRGGIEIDTVKEALGKLKKSGYTHVYCQPTHIMGGEEYDDLCADASGFASQFEVLKIGRPLLFHTVDFPALVSALHEVIAPSEDTAYVLMGHGTTHTANMVYPAFDYWLKRLGYPNVFVGTVEGYPTLDTVLEQLGEASYSKVVMLPMMLVAGDHAQNDMAGDEEDSWKSVLSRHGYQVTVKLNGFGEYPEVQKLYVQHVREMLEEDKV